MDLLQTVLGAQNGGAVDQIGRSFGLDQEQTASAIGQLLPALAAGLSRNAAQPGGVATLAMGALARRSAAPYAGAVQTGDSGVLGMLAPLLDANKDGSVTDDVMGMLGKFLR
jgi:hypothetical protein